MQAEEVKGYSVYTPIVSKPGVVYESIKGILRTYKSNNSVNSNLDLDTELVRDFFLTRSKTNHFKDFTDSTTSWYLALLKGSTEIDKFIRKNKCSVLDLGCGRSNLYQWLNASYYEQIKSYLGVDIDHVCIEQRKKLNFEKNAEYVVGNIDNIKEFWPDTIRFNAVFCINVFPYLTCVDTLIEFLSHKLTANDILVVVDPVPSYYWEKTFGGFTIKIRTQDKIINSLERFKFDAVEKGMLYTIKLFNKKLGPISSVTIFSKN